MNPLSGQKVMVAGHICLDIAPRFPQAPGSGLAQVLVPGKLVNVDKAVLCTGGAVSNTGLAMAKLGVDVRLNGKIGNDHFGQIIRQLVGTERSASFKVVEGQDSSYSIIIAIAGIDRIFLHNPGTNDTFGAEDVDYAALKECKLFHFGYPPLMKRIYQNDGAELIEMFKNAKASGATTSLDMTLPDPASESGKVNWKKVLTSLLSYVDLFMPSIEETAYMFAPDLFYARRSQANGDDAVHAYKYEDYNFLSQQLLDLRVKVIALKSGIRGYYLRTGNFESIGKAAVRLNNWQNRELWAPSFTAQQFGSATGAGDATIAGFLSAILAGYDPENSLCIANTLGWENVRAIDALSGIEDWDATIKYVADKSRKQNPSGLESIWKFSSQDLVFHGPEDKN
jgi:sugar/nucleoside kinase (ribokinase family)